MIYTESKYLDEHMNYFSEITPKVHVACSDYCNFPWPVLTLFEPRREKTGFLHMRKKDADQLRGNREADQRLCFRYIDSTIPHLSKSEISSI